MSRPFVTGDRERGGGRSAASGPLPVARHGLLAFAAIVEIGTGLVLLLDPAVVVELLLGAEVARVGAVLGRCFGIALLALGWACWPGPARHEHGVAAACRAMLAYNALIALYLAYLGTVERSTGWLLWPAVALHAFVALGLAWTGRAAATPG